MVHGGVWSCVRYCYHEYNYSGGLFYISLMIIEDRRIENIEKVWAGLILYARLWCSIWLKNSVNGLLDVKHFDDCLYWAFQDECRNRSLIRGETKQEKKLFSLSTRFFSRVVSCTNLRHQSSLLIDDFLPSEILFYSNNLWKAIIMHSQFWLKKASHFSPPFLFDINSRLYSLPSPLLDPRFNFYL